MQRPERAVLPNTLLPGMFTHSDDTREKLEGGGDAFHRMELLTVLLMEVLEEGS